MEYILELKPSEYYVNACISIGQAMESLINLSELFGEEWIATEAKKVATPAEPVSASQEPAKAETVQPQSKANASLGALISEWWKKFKQWIVSKFGGSSPAELANIELEADETYPANDAATAIEKAVNKVMMAKTKEDAEAIKAELDKALDDIGKKENELKKRMTGRKVDKVNVGRLKRTFSSTVKAANRLQKLDKKDLKILNAQRSVIEKAMKELEKNTTAKTDEKFVKKENKSAKKTGKKIVSKQQTLNKHDAKRRAIEDKLERRQAKKDAKAAKKAGISLDDEEE